MKAKPDCVVCLFKQALNTSRIVSEDPEFAVMVMSKLGCDLGSVSLDQTPAGMSQPVYEMIAELSGVADPYARHKKESNRIAMSLLPTLRRAITRSRDPLKAAVHAAVAGNIIDLGIGHKFDIRKDTLSTLKSRFAIDDSGGFRRELKPGRRLLYLGDNAGEIVFDTLLVSEIVKRGVDITYTVKSGPIINDATMDDAVETGMTKLCRVIETGSADIGVNWERASSLFVREFERADVIVAKGHGNYETCEDRSENIYCLLKAKCDMVARSLGVKLGDIVFKHL